MIQQTKTTKPRASSPSMSHYRSISNRSGKKTRSNFIDCIKNRTTNTISKEILHNDDSRTFSSPPTRIGLTKRPKISSTLEGARSGPPVPGLNSISLSPSISPSAASRAPSVQQRWNGLQQLQVSQRCRDADRTTLTAMLSFRVLWKT